MPGVNNLFTPGYAFLLEGTSNNKCNCNYDIGAGGQFLAVEKFTQMR